MERSPTRPSKKIYEVRYLKDEINPSKAKDSVPISRDESEFIPLSIEMSAPDTAPRGSALAIDAPQSSAKSPSQGSSAFSDIGKRSPTASSDLSESFTELENYTSQVLSDYENELESNDTPTSHYTSSKDRSPSSQSRSVKTRERVCNGNDQSGERIWEPLDFAKSRCKAGDSEAFHSDSLQELIPNNIDDTTDMVHPGRSISCRNNSHLGLGNEHHTEGIPALTALESLGARDENEETTPKATVSCEEGRFDKMIRKSMFLYHWSAASEALGQDSLYTAQDHACDALKLLDEIETRGEECPAFIDFHDGEDYDATYHSEDWESDSESSDFEHNRMDRGFTARFDLHSIRFHSFFGQDQVKLAMGVLEELQEAVDKNKTVAEDKDRAYVHGWRATCLKTFLKDTLDYDPDGFCEGEELEDVDTETDSSSDKQDDDDDNEICTELEDLYNQAESSCSKAISLLGEAYGGYYPIFRSDCQGKTTGSTLQSNDRLRLLMYQSAFESFLKDMIEIQELWEDEGKEGYYKWLLEDFKSAKDISEIEKDDKEVEEEPHFENESDEKMRSKESQCGECTVMIQETFCGRISTSRRILGLQLFLAFAVPAVLIMSGGWALDRLVG